MSTKKLLVAACYDSFLKASLNVANTFTNKNYQVDYFIYKDYRDSDNKHFREIGFGYTYKKGWIQDLFRDDRIFDYDAIMLSMEGPAIHKFYQLFSKRICELYLKRRPILFAGYVGIVYENFMQGFMDRQPVDIYYVNCKYDLELFGEYCRRLKLPSDNIILSGLPMLDTAYKLKPNRHKKSKALLFAGQPTVPKSLAERTHVIKKLIEYATLHPDEIVYFKPRHKPFQSTFHMVMFHYEDILSYLRKKHKIPTNFIFTYEPILELLKKVDLCLTVSSTAAFEALCMGVPVGFIADFGISEKYGNYYFAHCNCMTTFERLDLKNPTSMDTQWLDSHYYCDGQNTERVFKAVDHLVNDQQKSSAMRPLRRYLKGEMICDFNESTKKKQHKSDIVNKIAQSIIIKLFRLLSKTSPIIYNKLLS